jgi:AcrR family transcriptional regulator
MVQPRVRNKVIDALLSLAAERRWEEVTLQALAERAGMTLSTLRAAYDGRLSVLADFVRRTDERVLAAVDLDMAEEAPRERLFDVLFSRFEALGPHRQAVRNIGEAARRDPLLALELNRIGVGSMAWMLTAAGISSTGGAGLLRAQALALVMARVIRVWLEDKDPGLARTMAELDTRLRQAERMAIRLDWLGRILHGGGRKRAEPQPSASRDAGDVAEGHPS